MGKISKIIFDDTREYYLPGDTLTGRVEYDFAKAIRVKFIELVISGKAVVGWTQGRGRRADTNQRAQEEYFNYTDLLAGNKSGKKVEIPPGKQVYKFKYVLQTPLPSSFQGVFGSVRYFVKATVVKGKCKSLIIDTVDFIIMNPLTLEAIKAQKVPIEMRLEKKLCCLCCASVPLAVTVRCPRSGFCVMDDIPLSVEVANKSAAMVLYVRASLRKIVTYTSYSPIKTSTKMETETVAMIQEGPLSPTGPQNFELTLPVPQGLPSNLHCNIIEVKHDIMVECAVVGMNVNLSKSHEVFICNIPSGTKPRKVRQRKKRGGDGDMEGEEEDVDELERRVEEVERKVNEVARQGAAVVTQQGPGDHLNGQMKRRRKSRKRGASTKSKGISKGDKLEHRHRRKSRRRSRERGVSRGKRTSSGTPEHRKKRERESRKRKRSQEHEVSRGKGIASGNTLERQHRRKSRRRSRERQMSRGKRTSSGTPEHRQKRERELRRRRRSRESKLPRGKGVARGDARDRGQMRRESDSRRRDKSKRKKRRGQKGDSTTGDSWRSRRGSRKGKRRKSSRESRTGEGRRLSKESRTGEDGIPNQDVSLGKEQMPGEDVTSLNKQETDGGKLKPLPPWLRFFSKMFEFYNPVPKKCPCTFKSGELRKRKCCHL